MKCGHWISEYDPDPCRRCSEEEAVRKKLRDEIEALKRYTQHLSNCDTQLYDYGDFNPRSSICSCGLDKAHPGRERDGN